MLMTNGVGAVLGSLIAGFVIDHFFTDPACNDMTAICKDWRGIWTAFALYALAMAVLFVPLFKHRHDPNRRSRRTARAMSATLSAARPWMIPASSSSARSTSTTSGASPRCRNPGATLSGDYASGPGGKGFNQAMAARRAGAATAFVCALGEDAGAQLARALCVGDDIDLRDFACDAAPAPGIYVDANGRNEIVVAPGANARLEPRFVESTLVRAGAPSVVLAQLESPPEAIARLCASVANAARRRSSAPRRRMSRCRVRCWRWRTC